MDKIPDYIKKLENGFYFFDEEKYLKSLPNGLNYFAVDEKNEKVYGLGKDYNKQIADLEAELLKFAHRISDQNEEILELKQQLAEKENLLQTYIQLNESLTKRLDDRCDVCIERHKQSQNQTAIETLEKVKEKLNKYNKEHCFLSTEIDTCEKAVEFVDQQIKELKGDV